VKYLSRHRGSLELMTIKVGSGRNLMKPRSKFEPFKHTFACFNVFGNMAKLHTIRYIYVRSKADKMASLI